jgi:hypothetical protein
MSVFVKTIQYKVSASKLLGDVTFFYGGFHRPQINEIAKNLETVALTEETCTDS